MTDVCIITSVHKPLDTRIFHREARTLVEAGHHVTVVAPADLEREIHDGVIILGVKVPGSRVQRVRVWCDIFRQVRNLKPDVIHFHDPELLLLVPLFRLRFGKRVRLIYDVHEYFIAALSSKYWVPPWLRPIVARMAAMLERLIVDQTDGIICAVEGQLPLYDTFQGPKVVVRNLPSAELFANPEPHPALDEARLKLIYVGLILPKRGIDLLLDAMHILHQQDHDDISLYLIGPETSPEYVHAVQTFVRQHGLDSRVKWLGYVPPDRIKHYLANAHVGLVPGRYTQQYRNPGLTTKLFEYLLMGLPVLTVDYPHRRVYVEESQCGLVVPTEDVEAHVDAILWFRDHPEEARAMGERGRAMVLDHYTWDRERRRLLNFYDQIIS